MKRLIGLTVIAAVVTLAGCSTSGYPGGSDAWAWNPQNYQGGTVIDYKKYEVVDGESHKVVEVKWYDFKDKDDLAATVTLPDGTALSYSATELRGLDRAAIRARVEEAANAAGLELSGGLLDALVSGLTGGL